MERPIRYGLSDRKTGGQANADLFQLWIPNGEIRKLFADLVEEWFQETARADSARINRFCAAFPAGDVTAIQEMLHDYLVGFHQCAGHGGTEEPEGKLLPWDAAGPAQKPGKLAGEVQRRDGGGGTSDITVQTPDRIGIVIELKYAEDGNLESSCKAALAQIEDRKYGEGLKRRGVKKLLQYGIAFCEKECLVVMA